MGVTPNIILMGVPCFGLYDTPSIDSIIGAPGAKASIFHAPHPPPIYPIIGARSPGANPFTYTLGGGILQDPLWHPD